MSAILTAEQAAVAALTAEVQNVVTKINQLAAEVATTDDPAARQALVDQITAATAALSAVAPPPSAPPAP